MPTVADCLRQHGELFLQEYGDKVTFQQRKVLSAITRCRTGELGHRRGTRLKAFSSSVQPPVSDLQSSLSRLRRCVERHCNPRR